MILMTPRLALGRWIGHQAIPKRGRDRIVRALINPDDATLDVPFETDFHGLKYNGNLNNFIDWSVYFYGSYSSNELYLLRDITTLLKKQATGIAFYDVGANVGHHTLFMSAFADKVISFEPLESVRVKLMEKIKANNICNVNVFPVGLGSQDAEFPFSAPTGANQGTGTFANHGDDDHTTVLSVRRGSTLIEEYCLPKIDLLKIDVEGYEAEVIKGLHNVIIKDRPVILMEISGVDRSGFGNYGTFASLIYSDFSAYGVGTTSINGTYTICPIDFAVHEEILIIPNELIDVCSKLFTAARQSK